MNASFLKTEKFNTNNGWGFGGAVGTHTYYSNGIVITHGHACFRHEPSESYTKVGLILNDKQDGDWVSVHQGPNKREGYGFFSPSVKEVMDASKLFLYENESGYMVAITQDSGAEFELNYHTYKLIKEVSI